METYMESMSKKVNLYFQPTLSQYSTKMSRKNHEKNLSNKKRELKTLFFYLFNFNYLYFMFSPYL